MLQAAGGSAAGNEPVVTTGGGGGGGEGADAGAKASSLIGREPDAILLSSDWKEWRGRGFGRQVKPGQRKWGRGPVSPYLAETNSWLWLG